MVSEPILQGESLFFNNPRAYDPCCQHIQGIPHIPRKIKRSGFFLKMNIPEIWIRKQPMIVQRRHFNTVPAKSGNKRIDFRC